MQNWITQIAWPHIWQPQALLLIQPPNPWSLMWFYLGFTSLCLLMVIGLPFVKMLHPELRSRLIKFAWTNLIIGLILFVCRYYQLPYLSMNLLRTLQELIAIIWLIYLAFFYFKKLPKLILASKVAERRNKYLPSA